MGNCSMLPAACFKAPQIEVTAAIENIEYAVIRPNSRTETKKKNIEFTLSPKINVPRSLEVSRNQKKTKSSQVPNVIMETFLAKQRLTTNYLIQEQEHSVREEDKKYHLNDQLEPSQETFIRRVLLENNLVSDFDEDTIQEFIIGFYSFEVEEDYTLFYEGEEAKVLFIVEEGSVVLTQEKSDERRECEAGDFFGLEAFEENTMRIETAISKTKTKLLGVSGEFYRSAIVYMNLKTNNERYEVIKSVFLFKYLEYSKQISLSKALNPIQFKPNAIVINENEGQDRIFIIQSGVVRETRKFKKIRTLTKGEIFCQMGLFLKLPCFYTFSVDQEDLIVFELQYKAIKDVLGNSYTKDIIFEIFKKSVLTSENLNVLLFHEQNDLFNIFKLNYYEKEDVVFPTESSKNKKICVVISGELRKSKGGKEVVAKTEDLFGQNIIDAKSDLDCDIICSDEALLLEASWEEIIKANQHNSPQHSDLCDTVAKLKRVPIFSTLKETKFLELAKNIHKESFPDGSTIYREGEISDKFFIIKSGKVKLLQQDKFVRDLETGGCFGEIPQITGEIRLFTVISIGVTECYTLKKDDFSSFDYNLSCEIKKLSSLNDMNVNLNDLFFVKTLGNGRFGKVYLVHNQKHFYAVKYAKIQTICKNKHLMNYYLNEKNIMLQIDHPFVVKLVKTLKNKDFLFFLLEYIDGIALKTYLEKKKKNDQRNIQETAFFGGILLCVINYLHSKHILHRDIKPDNCMIDKTGYLKVIDFGIAKELKDKNNTQTICGTPHYLAPEVIMAKGYSYSSDYWSLGITMFEIFYGYVPFGRSAKEVMDVYYEILNRKLVLPYEPKFNEINSFFRIVLSKNLIHRVCNYHLLRSHPFFHQFDFDELLTFAIKAPYIPESYTEQNSSNNNNILSSCNIPITQQMSTQTSIFLDESDPMDYSSEMLFIEEF